MRVLRLSVSTTISTGTVASVSCHTSESVTRAMLDMAVGGNPESRPSMMFMRTRKGREYGKFDNKSHGAAHKMNADLFWETKRPFAEKYSVEFDGFGEPAPESSAV